MIDRLKPNDWSICEQAIHSRNQQDRITTSLEEGGRVTFGLPNTVQVEGVESIVIPDTPFVFAVNKLTFITKTRYDIHCFSLRNQIVLLGHGKRKRKDPLGWEFLDGQNPLDIASQINSTNSGLPKVNVILSCRRAMPATKEKIQVKKNGDLTTKNVRLKNTRPPKGWPSVPNVIIPGSGVQYFSSTVYRSLVTAEVETNDSDFYKVTKKERLVNLRKRNNGSRWND